jgi:hypothetical protein
MFCTLLRYFCIYPFRLTSSSTSHLQPRVVAMTNVVLHPGAIVFVTGANGLVASHIVDQLLARGYHVRGSVRSVEKMAWLKEYFDDKYKDATFEMVEVPDMVADGCYNGLLEGEYSGAQNAPRVSRLKDYCNRLQWLHPRRRPHERISRPLQTPSHQS